MTQRELVFFSASLRLPVSALKVLQDLRIVFPKDRLLRYKHWELKEVYDDLLAVPFFSLLANSVC